jgi:hypothetical protein
MFTKILKRLGVIADHGAPVHAGVNPVYFTNVYEGPIFWVFSWRTADHSFGGTFDHVTQEDARCARDCWANMREVREHATFVHEG